MKDTTRRGFLAVAGAGTAVAGVAAISPSIAGAAAAAAPVAAPAATGSTPTPTVAGSLVAHVADVRSGNVSVMVGEREVVLHAPELVATLVRAAQ